jgi:hypothetical protein
MDQRKHEKQKKQRGQKKHGKQMGQRELYPYCYKEPILIAGRNPVGFHAGIRNI